MSLFFEVIQTLLLTFYYCVEAFITLFIPKSFRTTKSIYGEIALVTGAGSGIGRLISINLAKLGAKVVMWDVNTAGLESTKALIEDEGGEASMYFCDVTDRVQVYETAERVRREVGDVSVLVNNAGVVNGKWFLDIPDEKIEKVMEVNVIAHFWTLKAFLPHMMTLNHGHIVTISSIAGRSPTARLVDYCASKYGALGLHESLAVELRALGKDGIQLTNICPFFINTGMFEGAKARLPFLLPLTEPEYVAQRVVSAILLNQYQVYIPRSLYFLMPLRALLPRKAIIATEDFLGVQEFMASFVGREGATRGRRVSSFRQEEHTETVVRNLGPYNFR